MTYVKGGWVAGRSPEAALSYFKNTCTGQEHAGAYHLEHGQLVAEVDSWRAGVRVGATRGLGDGAFLSWLSGVDPVTGEVKGQIRGSTGVRAAGRYTEKVVNNPKTLSVVASQNPAVAAALDALLDAQAAAIAGYVSRVAVVRKGPAGGQVEVGGVTVETARVTHATSREGDPHAHVHLLVNTRAQLPDGSWGAVHTRSLWKHGAAINALAQQVLLTDQSFRAVLAGQGFTLGADGEIDQARDAVEVMSKRSAVIDANRARIEAAWHGEHPGEVASESVRNGWKDRAWREGRKAKPARGETPTERAERVRVELARAGFDFTPAATATAGAGRSGAVRVDAVALSTVGDVARAGLVDTLAAAVVAELEGRASAWSAAQLNATVAARVGAAGVVGTLEQVGVLAGEVSGAVAGRCVSLLDDTRAPTSMSVHLSTPRVLAEDEHLQLGLAALTTGDGRRDLAAGAAAVEQGLSPAQGVAVAAVAGTRRLEVVEGPAGSGKTRMLALAREQVEASGRVLRIYGASRQAALVAAAEVGTDGSSVHGLLFQYGWRWTENDQWTRLTVGEVCPVTGRVYTGPAVGAGLDERSVAVVDEAGMLSVPAAAALTDVLAETGAAVRFLGDRQQLGPVGRGGVLDAAARWAEEPVQLDVVHRFTRTVVDVDGWPATVTDHDYASLTLQMRDRADPAEIADVLHQRGLVMWHADRDAMLDAVAADATTAQPGSPTGAGTAGVVGVGGVAVTASTNADVDDLNDRIRAARVSAGAVDDSVTVTGRGGDRIGVGDVVVTRRNDTALDVSNRQRWTVTAVHDGGELTVTSDNHASTAGAAREVQLPAGYVNAHVGLGYAATAHGNQGVTSDRAVSVVGEATDAAGLYVQMTRGRTGNTAHLIAEDWAGAREQLIRAMDRDRGDRGLDAATGAAYTESVPHPDLAATAGQQAPAERVEVLLEQLRTAWTAQANAQHTLKLFTPKLDRARADAAGEERTAAVLAPLAEQMTATAQAAQAAADRAAPARAELAGRAEQIRGALHEAWNADRPAAAHAAQVIEAGTGRFGRGRSEVNAQQDNLDQWGQRWSEVVPALADPAVAVRYAGQHPGNDWVGAVFARYADTRAAAELPGHVAAVDAADGAARAAELARAAHDQTEDGLRQRQLLRRSSTGWRDTAVDVDRYTSRVERAQRQLAGADAVIDAVTADPAITARPDAPQLLTAARTTWTVDRAAAEAAARQAQAEQASRAAAQHRHDVPHHSPSSHRDHGISR